MHAAFLDFISQTDTAVIQRNALLLLVGLETKVQTWSENSLCMWPEEFLKHDLRTRSFFNSQSHLLPNPITLLPDAD